MRCTTCVMFALVLGAGARARANSLPEREEPEAAPTLVTSVGFSFGDMAVDRYDPELDSFVFSAGLPWGPNLAYAEILLGYQHGDRGDQHESGFAGSASAHLRRELASHRTGGGGDWMSFATWIDVGIGYQTLRWQAGGVERPESSLSVGGGFLFGKHAHSIGESIELRLIAAPGVTWEASVGRCSGPCEMTAPSLHRLDVGALLMFSFPFSR